MDLGPRGLPACRDLGLQAQPRSNGAGARSDLPRGRSPRRIAGTFSRWPISIPASSARCACN